MRLASLSAATLRTVVPIVVFGLAPAAMADGFIVIPRRPPDQPHVRNVPLAVKYHRVTVKVEGRVAVTEIDQVFVNHNPRRVEGTYLFPLPVGAAIDRFGMWVDGKELTAELLDATKARRIYEDIVRRQQDPALMEYMDRGLFKARIFPIEPHSEKRVRIRYAEVLSADNGTVAYRYPLNTEKFSSRPLEHVSIDVTIEDRLPITSVFSPSHDVDVPEKLGTSVRLGWEARDVKPDRDFLLYWRPTQKDVGLTLVSHRVDKEGTFLLVLSPSPEADTTAIPKDVVFVMDTSGSMAGKKIEQARGALRYCLRSLGPEDRFGIVPFATEPRPFRKTLAPANAETRSQAETFVSRLEARGGTAIDDALRTALGMLAGGDSTRPRMVLFVTDGLPTIGEIDPERILKRAGKVAGSTRLFVFGIGDDVNTHLLDRLAADNRGTRDYVAETESIEEKVSNLYAKLAKPAMTDIELVIDGVDATAVHPKRLGDLFHGAELLVVGRYAKPGNAVIRLRGSVRGEKREIVEEVRLPEKEERHEFLPRLWGVRRVAYLLDQIRLHGETGELRDEVVRLARDHGIVTPYTSYLILEDEARGGRTASGPRPRDRRPGFFGWEGASDRGGVGGGGGGSGADPASGAPPAPTAPEAEALDDLRRRAADAGEGERAKSGKKAVDVAREVGDLDRYRGDRDAPALGKSGRRTEALVRHLHGRTFISRGGIWWDADVDLSRTRRQIVAFSEAYFELVRAHPKLGKLLTLGDTILVVGDEVIEIRRSDG